eukprot:CAMPEP_0180618296 /NCGR_PEP_ID=MMETSP1037_2-20121125/33494_1 /TAXON_ID=632150 /ORGANISM="Azadinium spinosum, Strain 3D9" /LENGTH=181 /DNA_ID=CAMNT_0022638305 /DNA_START=186 /DNA_END=734 /DNA_ORIENTATION=-
MSLSSSSTPVKSSRFTPKTRRSASPALFSTKAIAKEISAPSGATNVPPGDASLRVAATAPIERESGRILRATSPSPPHAAARLGLGAASSSHHRPIDTVRVAFVAALELLSRNLVSVTPLHKAEVLILLVHDEEVSAPQADDLITYDLNGLLILAPPRALYLAEHPRPAQLAPVVLPLPHV